MLRKVVASARYVPRTPKVQPKASLRARAQAYLRTVLHETFPTISHDLSYGSRQAHAYALQPIQLGSRSFTPQSARARLHTASRTFRSSYALPHAARGGRTGANVGLGSARGFASSGPVQGQVQAHVPMGLRAFAALLSDEEHDKALPRPTRVHPYSPAARKYKRVRTARRLQSICSVDSRISTPSALAHYFPARPAPSVELPVAIESLVTPGETTVLLLPLSPSLSALLDPTPRIPYSDASVGVAVLSTLTSGLMSLQEAFGIHFADRILPLLAHVDALGVLQMQPAMAYEVVCDVMGQPDILRLTFHGRSVPDVRRLLGERLAGDGWYCLREDASCVEPVKETSKITPEQNGGLNNGEQRYIMEDWKTTLPESPRAELIMPVLDASVQNDWPVSSLQQGSTPEWPLSNLSSPISGMDYSSIPSNASSGFASPLHSSSETSSNLNASLLSQLSSMEAHTDGSWHSPPSEADSDVESAISAEVIDALNEVWNVEQVEQVETGEVDMASMGWTGSMYVWSGDGFGLAQPW